LGFMELREKVAVVTGAAVGTGRAIARRLGAEGAAVVLADIDAAECERTRQLVEEAGGQATMITTDVCSDESVAAMIDFAGESFGRLDILVNNAGGGGHIPPHFPEASPSRWSGLLELNLRSAMFATQLAIDAMRDGGVVINVGSTAGFNTGAYRSPEYGAAKAGLMRFTSALADLPERRNVRAACVVPDWIGTERAYHELATMSAAQRAELPQQPVPLSAFTDAVVELIQRDELSGRILVLMPGQASRLLE
jgi:NAD(P)-dependent dehydrogenase (short-subunit alcohol dehydrogenase family)